MTSTGWISTAFGSDIHYSQRMYPTDFDHFSAITTLLGIPLSKDTSKHFHFGSRTELFGGIFVIVTVEVQLKFFVRFKMKVTT